MTTHLRARVAQAGALLAVVVGGIAGAPAVALADPPDVQITDLATEVLSGAPITMQYRVADRNDGEGQSVTAAIEVNSELRCSGECSNPQTAVDRGGRTFTARFTAPNVAAGETRDVRIEVSAEIGDERQSADATVVVKGPDKPRFVRQVTGKVRDQDGKAIADAAVAIRDSSGNNHQATSNGSGGYSFTSSESKPIAPGTVLVGAGKSGYDPVSVQVQALAGRSVTVPLTLTLLESTPSPSASASPSRSAAATATPADETTQPVTQNTVAAEPETRAATEDDSNSMLYLILGGLLVAAGVGAIVLVLMRRRGNDDDDDPAGPGGGGVLPPSQGRLTDATRVAAPMAAASAAATIVAPRSGAPSMSDAPTVLQRPVPADDDEFADPYGVPIPPQGGYAGASAGGWDAPPVDYAAENSYGAPTQYGAAVDDGYGGDNGYGAAPGGGYGYGDAQPQPQRFDEPTGLYRPGQDAGYDAGGYPGDHGDGQYGGAHQYDAADGYGDGQQQYGGYGAPDQGGWDAPVGGTEHAGNAYGTEHSGNAYGTEHSGNAYGTEHSANVYGTAQGGGTYGAPAPAGQQYGGQQYGGYGEANGYADEPAAYDERAGYGGQDQSAYREQYDEPTGYDSHGYRRQPR